MTEQLTREPTRLTGGILATLGLLAILGPLGTDIFLPALPAIADDFGETAAAAQLSLTGFTFGMAFGQLVAGPLSDAVGRRRPLIVGAGAMALASAAAAAAPNLALLVTACVITGVACAFGLVIGRGVVPDLAHGPQIVRSFSLLGGMLSIGPVIGPLAGVALMAIGGWRATFAGLAVLAATACIIVTIVIPETHPAERRIRMHLGALSDIAAQAFRSRHFLAGALVGWFSFIAMFAYIASSPFVIQDVLGFTPLGYSIVFGVNGCALIVTSLLAGRLANRLGERGAMAVGLAMQTLGAILIGLAVVTGSLTVWLMLPGMLLVASSMGFIIGPSIAESIKELRHATGTASALLGAVQWLLAGIAAPLVSAAGRLAVWPLAVMVLGGVAFAWLSLALTRPRGERA